MKLLISALLLVFSKRYRQIVMYAELSERYDSIPSNRSTNLNRYFKEV